MSASNISPTAQILYSLANPIQNKQLEGAACEGWDGCWQEANRNARKIRHHALHGPSFPSSSTDTSLLNLLICLPCDYVTRSQKKIRTALFQNKHKLILHVHTEAIIS